MKAIAWSIFSVGCLAISAYADIAGHAGAAIGSGLWAIVGFLGLLAQPGDSQRGR
jgi:hypothetical protein